MRVDNAWAAVAKRFGLDATRGAFKGNCEITGHLEGFEMTVDSYKRTPPGAKEMRVFTRYRLSQPSLGPEFVVEPVRKVGARRYKSVTRAIETGDEAFDRTYTIRGKNQVALREFFDARRIAIIKGFMANRRRVHRIDQRSIRYDSLGFEEDSTRLAETLLAMCKLADDLRDTVELPATPTAAPTSPAPEPVTPTPAPVVAEPAVDESPPTEAPRVAEPEPTPEMPDASEPEPPLDDREVAQALFGGSEPGFEVTRRFDETYAGQRIRWTGTLDHFESFRSDRVFGSDPGTRVTLDLLELDGEGSSRDVRLVAAFPPGAGDGLDDERGNPLEIIGTLVRCDPFLRVLFVSTDAHEATRSRGRESLTR